MPTDLAAIHFDPDQFPAEPLPCLRCGEVTAMRSRGPCPKCVGELREKYQREAREVASAACAPAMHGTPNAVALKDCPAEPSSGRWVSSRVDGYDGHPRTRLGNGRLLRDARDRAER